MLHYRDAGSSRRLTLPASQIRSCPNRSLCGRGSSSPWNLSAIYTPGSTTVARRSVSRCHWNFETAATNSRAIKQAIRDELDLPASVGIAPLKFVAKIASDINKPDGFVEVANDGASFSGSITCLAVILPNLPHQGIKADCTRMHHLPIISRWASVTFRSQRQQIHIDPFAACGSCRVDFLHPHVRIRNRVVVAADLTCDFSVRHPTGNQQFTDSGMDFGW